MEVKNWGAGRRDLIAPFLTRLTNLYCRTAETADYGHDQERLREEGPAGYVPDAWIAAAGMQLNVPLATHNGVISQPSRSANLTAPTTV